MVEVECRICLKMTTLDNSFTITTEFLLGKSFKEVILMFVPQMITIIWNDDVICFSCSGALFALAQFIKRLMASEVVLKNDNKRIKNAWGNTEVKSESTVIKEEPSELTLQYEGKMKLQPRPMQVKCRTCFQEIHSLKKATSLSDKLLLGKTFKEVILRFILHMVPISGNDEIICVNCSKTLHDFAEFIKRCIAIKEIFENDTKIKDKIKKNKVENRLNEYDVPDINTQEYSERFIQDLRKKWRTRSQLVQSLQKLPSQLNFNANSVKRTYSRKPKIKEELEESSVNEESSEAPLSTITSTHLIENSTITCQENQIEISLQTVPVKEEEYSEPRLSNVTSSNWVENSTISCQEYPIEPSLMVLYAEEEEPSEQHLLFDATSTNSVEKSTSCQDNRIEKSLPTAVKDEIVEISDDDDDEETNSPVLTAIKGDIVEISDEDEETTEPPVQPLFNSAKDDQGHTDIFTINLSDNDEETSPPVKNENCDITTTANDENSLDDTPPRCSTASNNSDTVNPTDDFGVSIKNEYSDGSETADIIKQFNIIKGDSICNYPIQFHDRVVSISQSNNVRPTFLEDLSMCNILIYHLGVPKDMKNKRVLLLGSAMTPCTICKAECTRRSLMSHMRLMHDTDLPRSKNDAIYSCVLRPSKDKDNKLPKLENDELYILDYIVKPSVVENTYPCPVCKTNAYSSRLLKRHMLRVHNDFRPYICEKCGAMFKVKHNYYLHVKKYQDFPNCSNLRKCSVCSQMISRNNFSRHVRAHERFICGECGYSCLSATYLRVHSKMHQNGKFKNRKYKSCPICGKFSKYLTNHMRSHEPRKYKCDQCPKHYLTLEAYNRHIKNDCHGGEFQCKKCSRVCKTVKSLREHIKLKHSKAEQHKCKVCGQQFHRADYFKRHMRHHIKSNKLKERIQTYSFASTNSGLMPCNYCKKTFKTMSLLKLHLLTHGLRIRYKCRSCDNTFSDVQARQRHEKKHKDLPAEAERIRYKCRICDVTYASAQFRQLHEKKHNDPTFNLRCKVCWKLTENKKELEEHTKEHRVRKRYRCRYCEERFSRLFLLNQHVYKKHSKEKETEKEEQVIISETLMMEYLI